MKFNAIARRFALYTLGLTGFIFAGVAALEDPSFSNFAAITASLTALLVDYLWLSKSDSEHPDYHEYKVTALRKMGRREGLQKVDTMNREVLVEELSRLATVNLQKSQIGWGVTKWTGLLLALVTIPTVYFLFPSAQRIPPNVEIAWYNFEDGRIRLSDPRAVPAELGVDDVAANRIRIPVRLAVRNNDNDPLSVTRIELSYSKNLAVISSGKAKIQPGESRLIYEHDIGTLEAQDEFTPLEEIDVLTIPFQFFFVRAVAVTSDNVPTQIGTLIGQDVIQEKKITLGVRIYSAGRPPANGEVSLIPTSGVQIFTDLDEHFSERVPSLESDGSLFEREFPLGTIISSWEGFHSESGTTIGYALEDTFIGRIRRASVNGVVRNLAVDQDFDGSIDYLLLKGAPEEEITRFEFSAPYPLLDWKLEEVTD